MGWGRGKVGNLGGMGIKEEGDGLAHEVGDGSTLMEGDDAERFVGISFDNSGGVDGVGNAFLVSHRKKHPLHNCVYKV